MIKKMDLVIAVPRTRAQLDEFPGSYKTPVHNDLSAIKGHKPLTYHIIIHIAIDKKRL